MANKAVIEGPAVLSIGFLDEMSNVNFSENVYYCQAGEYGYIDKNEASTVNRETHIYLPWHETSGQSINRCLSLLIAGTQHDLVYLHGRYCL